MHIYIWKERNGKCGKNWGKGYTRVIYTSPATFGQEWNYFQVKSFFTCRFLNPIPQESPTHWIFGRPRNLHFQQAPQRIPTHRKSDCNSSSEESWGIPSPSGRGTAPVVFTLLSPLFQATMKEPLMEAFASQ